MRLLILCFASTALFAQDDTSSAEKERALGRSTAQEIRKASRPVNDVAVEQYVSSVGARLVSQLAGESPDFHFEALLMEGAEPAPVPGGTVFIPAAFLAAVHSESEFAGMLAHAIGHTVLRHGLRSAKPPGGWAGIPLIFIGSLSSHASSQGKDSLRIPVGLLKLQREYELEADSFAVELTGRAGYDASAIRTYIERVQAAQIKPEYSPLPSLPVRLENLRKAVAISRPSSPEFLQAQTAIRRMLERQRPAPTLRRVGDLR